MDSDKPNLAGKIRITSVEESSYLQLAKDMLAMAASQGDQQTYFLKRAEVAALIAIAQKEPGTTLESMTRKALDEAERSAAAWQQTAEMHLKNESYYHDLLNKIGELFGGEAKRADNGDMMTQVICVKVPQLVEELVQDFDCAMRFLRLLASKIDYCAHPDCPTCGQRKIELRGLLTKYPKGEPI